MQKNKIEAYKLLKTAFPVSNREQSNNWLGELFIWLADYDSARVCLESAVKQNNLFMQLPRFQACLALANFKTGNHQNAGAIIRKLIDRGDKTTAGSSDYFIGWYYSGIDMPDSAFYWLEKAYKNNSPEFPWLKVDPVFKNLKKDLRYLDLYARTGHKAYDDYISGMKKK